MRQKIRKPSIHQGYYYGMDNDTVERVHRYVEIQANYLYETTKPLRVLDVGAADGYMLSLFKKKKCKVTGIDINPLSPSVKELTIHQLPEIETYDLIVYNHVLEHCIDYKEQLDASVKRIMAGGYLFIAVPEGNSPWAYEYEGHVVRFTQDKLVETLQDALMTVVETFHVRFREDKEEIWALSQKLV